MKLHSVPKRRLAFLSLIQIKMADSSELDKNLIFTTPIENVEHRYSITDNE